MPALMAPLRPAHAPVHGRSMAEDLGEVGHVPLGLDICGVRGRNGAADMTAEDLDELRELGLDDAEVLDVVLAAAARCFFSTVLDAVGAQPDAAYAGLDPRVRDALTVGRPIAT